MESRTPARTVPVIGLLAAVLLTVVWWMTSPHRGSGPRSLLVYCAHDAVYAEPILKQFEAQTGIPVSIRFDTEATKSLGLIQRLQSERNSPQCDVFWNNELLGMLSLEQGGLLEPYRGEGWKRLPDEFRDPEGDWVGFGGRLRVWIYRPDEIAGDEAVLSEELQKAPERFAFAKPLYGTTLTHYSLLWHVLGAEALKQRHDDWLSRGWVEVNGNGVVQEVVGAGTCVAGWTDTDDAFVALDAGKPVAMVPIRIEGKAICIPNTAAIIRGSRRRNEAEQLIDYLASADVEIALSKSASRQIPLGPVDPSQVPDQVRPLLEAAQESWSLRAILPARNECLEWLKQRYTGG